jgi:hypothetical protein
MMVLQWILSVWLLMASDGKNTLMKEDWGFFGHQKINRLAVFTLPVEMIPFYKYHIEYISEKAVNPDMRRYIDPEEAPRHYIDLDVYGDSAWADMPRYWNDAVDMYTEDTLKAYGTVPWHVVKVKNYLTKAFRNQNSDQILRLSAELGHYIADGNVPLHTTENYNGQLTDQYGIHGFWESRLPELFFDEYDLFTGKATYITNTQLEIWEGVVAAHMALDSVFRFERELTERFRPEKKYAYEDRNGRTLRVYAYDFSAAYHRKLDGMVERRMRATIKMIGDFWYTAWVDGGQPDLSLLIHAAPVDSFQVDKQRIMEGEHESGVVVGNKKP